MKLKIILVKREVIQKHPSRVRKLKLYSANIWKCK